MPEVTKEAKPIWRAWEILSTRRERNPSGPQAIRFSEVEAYLNLNVITDPDLREDIVRNILILDGMHLDKFYSSPQSKPQTPKKTRRSR